MMLRDLCSASLCCAVLAGCGSGRRAVAPSPASVVPGTYAMEICSGPCQGQAGDTVLARGHLVIEAAEYPLSELPLVARKYLEDDIFMRVRDDSIRDPNACFELTMVRRSGSYAGANRVGLTRAEPAGGDSVGVDLFHSPDAGYYVILQSVRGELRGRGRSWGVGDGRVDVPQDSVYARRIGRPDRALCIRAAEVEAAAREARRTPPRP
jgi:hypothetical protein